MGKEQTVMPSCGFIGAAVIKHPDKGILEENGIYLAHNSMLESIVGMSRWQKPISASCIALTMKS